MAVCPHNKITLGTCYLYIKISESQYLKGPCSKPNYAKPMDAQGFFGGESSQLRFNENYPIWSDKEQKNHRESHASHAAYDETSNFRRASAPQ